MFALTMNPLIFHKVAFMPQFCLPARSVLLPSAEVSTGHPHPHTPM
ncbi:MAG: hypothetical protein MJ177_03460 [Clostridia bacterium]|nr:hypothetical protein [Clostridia bacterium]